MILEQMYLPCLAQASYFLADREAGVAAVVDPRRDVDAYLERARELGVTIRHVLLTHFHADFVSGHLELRTATGARIHLGHGVSVDYEHEGRREGDVIELGSLRIHVLETPGHTPEGLSFVVHEHEGAPPHAVLTGDALFVGDVGRPDLMASVGLSAEELAGTLYDSLHDKLLELPDETLVYPAHGPGSLCGKNLGTETHSTIGVQRRTNQALLTPSKAEFVRQLTSQLPVTPRYFPHDARLNRRERPGLDLALKNALVPMSIEEVERARDEGAQLLDVREAETFAAGHLRGSINVGLEGRFAIWAGSVLDFDGSVVLIAAAGREREAALRLGRVGLDRVVGHLDGGEQTLHRHSERLVRHDREDPAAVHPRCSSEELLVLDVRNPGEYEQGHVAGSVNVPLGQLPDRLDEVPEGRGLAVLCLSGYRSSCATSLLRRAGRTELVDVRGGMEAWRASALPEVH